MKRIFYALGKHDTEDFRKDIGLPVYKELIYIDLDGIKHNVKEYEIVDTYYPSGTHSFLVTTTDGLQIRILADNFIDMQKPDFGKVSFGENEEESTKYKPGKCVTRLPKDYIVVDIETTGVTADDEITEIGAVKYVDHKEVDSFSELIHVDKEIPFIVQKKTGINNLMLIGKREQKDVLCDFAKFIYYSDAILMGHNFKSFDINHLNSAFKKEFGWPLPNDYVDTRDIAKKLSGSKKNSLEALAELYGVDYSNAHRAIADCRITQQIYMKMIEGIDEKDYQKMVKKKRSLPTASKEEQFTNDSSSQKRSKLNFPGSIRITDIVPDPNVTIDESNPFYEKNCVVSGDFDNFDRKEILQQLVNIGAKIKSSVSSKTHFLILGNMENVQTKQRGKSSKQMKAEDLQKNGHDIQIITESEFLELLKQNEIVNEDPQPTSDNSFDYVSEIQDILKKIESEMELPKNSLLLEEQNNKDQGQYLINIFEPEYPENKNAPTRKGIRTSALILKEEHKKIGDFLTLQIQPYLLDIFALPDGANLVGRRRNVEEDYQSIRFDFSDRSIVQYIEQIITHKIKRYKSKESFGCCSRHVQCSDALKCVHENKLYSTGCIYRSHLEKGEIFYGKNKNN